MKENVLNGKKNGMLVLLLEITVYILAITGFILGILSAETTWNATLSLICMAVMLLAWIPLLGLKILKPQEALVLTLFGRYVGTLKGDGFYWVNPFCISVIPLPRRS